MPVLKYFTTYPDEVKDPIRQLIAEDRLGAMLRRKYPTTHEVRTDSALYDYVLDLKNRYLRKTEPVSRVAYDSNLQVIKNALDHIHGDIARLFTLRATALQKTNRRAMKDLDFEMLRCAR